MPRIGRGQKIADKSWEETLAEKIKAGKAVPLLSNVVDNELVLQGHDALVKERSLHN